MKMQDDFRADGLVVIGVTDDSVEAARTFAKDHEINYAVLAGTEENAKAYGVDFIWGSTIYLVDPDGKIVARGIAEARKVLEAERGR